MFLYGACPYKQHGKWAKFELWQEKDKLALGFLKLYCKVYAAIKTKCGYQICFYLLNLQEAYH